MGVSFKNSSKAIRQRMNCGYLLNTHTFVITIYNLICRSSFSDFASKHGKDERFKAIEKMRERESLFNDYVSELRKKEKAEKQAAREKVKTNTVSNVYDSLIN